MFKYFSFSFATLLLIFVFVGFVPSTAQAVCIFGIGNTCPPPPPPPAGPPTNPTGGGGVPGAQCGPGETQVTDPNTGVSLGCTPAAPAQPPQQPQAPPAGGGGNTGPITYVPLQNLPGIGTTAPDPNLYLKQMFMLIIGLIIVLAFLMLVIGGFEYVFSASTGGKGDGRDRITGALLGLLIALASYLILNTINPDLVTFDIFKNAPVLGRPSETLFSAQQIQQAADAGSAFSNQTAAMLAAQSGQPGSLPIGGNSNALVDAVIGNETGGKCPPTQTTCTLTKTNTNGTTDVGVMQLNNQTACGLDPAACAAAGGPNSQAWITQLQNNQYNMQLGSQVLAKAQGACGNDAGCVFAYYNGGPGAVKPSTDCPGISAYQCPYNSPGCYNTGVTGCAVSPIYKPISNYVQNGLGTFNKITANQAAP